MKTKLLWLALALLYTIFIWYTINKPAIGETISVNSSAYNLVKSQTSGNPKIGACGMISKKQPAIAVSRDLRKRLPCNAKVKINGKIYTVRDTMANRWKNKIDICFYEDIKGAKHYGIKNVTMEIM